MITCLVVDTADGGGAPVADHVVVRGDHVHAFPLRLQWSVPRVVGADWVPTKCPAPSPPPGGATWWMPREGWDFYLTTRGDIHLATRGEFSTGTDTFTAHYHKAAHESYRVRTRRPPGHGALVEGSTSCRPNPSQTAGSEPGSNGE